MAVREIATVPDPVLRSKAKKVPAVTAEIRSLIDDMVETMRLAPGVGLAAPQVGVSQRVIVVEYAEGSENEDPDDSDGSESRPAPKPPKLYAVVNPQITRRSAGTGPGNEACLSIPELFGEVERHETVTVKGLDRFGKPFKLKASGWLARIFQHEIDHLNGVLFTDLATKLWRVEKAEEGQPPAV